MNLGNDILRDINETLECFEINDQALAFALAEVTLNYIVAETQAVFAEWQHSLDEFNASATMEGLKE